MTKVSKRGDFHEVIGDELYERFMGWYVEQRELLQRAVDEMAADPDPDSAAMALRKGVGLAHSMRAFVQWLITTGDGAVALQRINDAPRQLFLPFPDDERPYSVEETV
jgi:hypothetical protein